MTDNPLDAVEMLRSQENQAQLTAKFFHTLIAENVPLEAAVALTQTWLQSIFVGAMMSPPPEKDD